MKLAPFTGLSYFSSTLIALKSRHEPATTEY